MTKRTKKPAEAPAPPPDESGFSLISNEKLLALYAAMLKHRMLERRIHGERVGRLSAGKRRAGSRGAGIYPTDRAAAAAGVAIDLLPGDAICAPRGDLAHGSLKGASLKRIFSAVFAPPGTRSAAGRAEGARANAPAAAETLAGRLKALERAVRLGLRRKKTGKIVVLFCGPAEPANEVWFKSLRSAAAARLPILFVCHSGPREEDFAPRAQDHGLPGIAVDGADVVAIYRVASEAIAHARRGNGPTLIECRPWVVAARKRGRGFAAAGDAVRNMETYLAAKGLFTRRFKAETVAQFERALDEAVAAVSQVPKSGHGASGLSPKRASKGRRARLPSG